MRDPDFENLLKKAADKGDLSALCQHLESRLDPMVGLNGVGHAIPFNRLFRTAVINAGKKNAKQLNKELLLEMLSIQSLLLYRATTYTTQEIDKWDRSIDYSYGKLPYDLLTDYIPRISKLQEEVQSTLKAIAALDRKQPSDHVPQAVKS